LKMNRKGEDGSIKEPIKLRFKQLKDGNQSIYLDCYVNGIREYKFLNLYLRQDTSRENKMWNKEQLRLANAIKAQYIIDIQNREFGFKDRNRTRKLNFLTYCEDMAADLYTVSKLLGHSNIRTTQIYAKIVDESKRKAVNLIPKL
ncbi:MAG: hypothetical protein PUB73_02300, partial [Bacteroidales bacterium]|nr:hypothetical protein [Bacteroidales bacterium]